MEERPSENTPSHMVPAKVDSPTALNNNEKMSKPISTSNGTILTLNKTIQSKRKKRNYEN